MSKATVMVLQVSNADESSRQQMVMFPTSKAVFRRTLTTDNRTRWRHTAVGDLPPWTSGYVNLLANGDEKMNLNMGPFLMEVTPDEVADATGTTLSRNVQLRYDRVLKAVVKDPSTAAITTDVEAFVTAWVAAIDADDEAWLDAHTHAAGSCRPGSDEPEPEPVPVVPAPAPVVVAPAFATDYPAVVGGYVTRPNGERYKVRSIDGTPDVKVLQDSRLYREHVFFYGEPGTGKTALVDSAFGKKFVTVLGTEETEVADFVGSYTTRGAGTYGWSDGALAVAMTLGIPLFVDEIGVIAPKVLTTLFSIMDGRDELPVTANPDRGVITAMPGFVVIGATNPHAPGVRLSEALLSRFAVHIEVTTDYKVAREMGVPEVLVGAAENLDKRRATGEISWAPQMRELLRASAQWTSRGDKFAIRNLIGSAPEDDRAVVAEMLARTLGKKYKPLSL